MSTSQDHHSHIRGRSRARRLAMQALYQRELNPESETRLEKEYQEKREYADCNPDYFARVLRTALKDKDELMACVKCFADRPVEQIDPIELAILMVALTELKHVVEVPYKVIINEAIELARRFGSTDGHKYVNAILDKAAREMRPQETATSES